MDITYVPMARGFVYLAAVMDWASRRVLAWRVSISMSTDFCIEALEEAIARYGTPEIFNTGQGSQFTSVELSRRTTPRLAWTAKAAGATTRRAAVEVDQIRGSVLARLRNGERGTQWHRALSGVLQQPASAQFA